MAPLLGAARGASISHQAVGLEVGMARLSELAGGLFAAASSSDQPDLVVATVAGADYPEDVRLLERAIAALGLGRDLIVLNDTYGALRAGSSAGWGVGLVCGQGINAGAISPDGKRDRFPGVGEYAGDWGGGGGVGREAINAAVRGSDGRGATDLAGEIRAALLWRPDRRPQLTRAFYFERIPEDRVNDLAPARVRRRGRRRCNCALDHRSTCR